MSDLPSRYWPTLLAILASGSLTLHAQQVFACRCKEPVAKLAYRAADVAVLGKIVSAESSAGGGDETTYVVEVSEWWKQSVENKITVQSSTTCRFEAQVGARYVLFLKRNQQGRFETAMCMGNRSEKQAGTLLKYLRATKPSRRN